MNRYDTRDLQFTEDGDLALDANGDLATVEGNDLLEQMIRIPLKTTNPDWFNDAIGADMEDLLGLENSRDTAELGKTKIKQALIDTEFFEPEDIWIEAKPISQSAITFFVFIQSPFSVEGPLVYEVELDLGFGATTRRVY